MQYAPETISPPLYWVLLDMSWKGNMRHFFVILPSPKTELYVLTTIQMECWEILCLLMIFAVKHSVKYSSDILQAYSICCELQTLRV